MVGAYKSDTQERLVFGKIIGHAFPLNSFLIWFLAVTIFENNFHFSPQTQFVGNDLYYNSSQ